MTAEEAIKLLLESKDNNIERSLREWEEWDKRYFEAIDVAIDLLLRHDDLISRTELIHKLRHLEQFNNNDVPDWVWSAIGGTNE